jgi:hypothetical protein
MLIETYLEVALQERLDVDRWRVWRWQQVGPPEFVLHHELEIVATDPKPLFPAWTAIPPRSQLPTSLSGF